MARRKRSLALFEVIQKDKRFERSGSSSAVPRTQRGLPLPKWWFKGKLAAPPAGPSMTLPPPKALPTRRIMPVAKAVEAAHPPVPLPAPMLKREPVIKPAAPNAIEQTADDSWPVVNQPRDFAPLRTSEPAWFQHWPWLERAMQVLTPTSAAIILGAATLVALVDLAWTHWPHHTSVQAILQGPAHPEVLAVSTVHPTSGALDRTIPAGSSAQPSSATPASATFTPNRVVGHQYVLIHYYATARSAKLAETYLNQHDLLCTVEHNIAGVQPQLYAVLGLTPFARIGTPDYLAYVQQIRNLLPKIPGGSPSVKSFAPKLLKWNPAPAAGQSTAQAN